MKLVCVDWVDSASGRGWRDLDWWNNDTGALLCRSVGFLIRETKTDLWLAAHLAGESKDVVNQACGDMCIPKVAVTKVTVLKEPKR